MLFGNEFKIGAAYRFIPALAFLPVEKAQFLDPDRTPIDLIPELAIEVASSPETVAQMDRKVMAYWDAGVSEVWVVIPETEHICVYTSDGIRTFNNSKFLGSPLFPNWSMPVSAVFDLRL